MSHLYWVSQEEHIIATHGRDPSSTGVSPSLYEHVSGHRSDLGHCSDVSVGRGDRHRVVRSIQRFSLRTFSLGDSTKGREQDRQRFESIRAAPTDRVDTAAERLFQARRREAYI